MSELNKKEPVPGTPEQGIIYRLNSKDACAVAELEKACFTLPWTKENYLQALEQSAFILYGIKREGQLVSYVSFYHLYDEIEIINIATESNFRRLGYANKLLSFVMFDAVKNGFKRVLLEVRESNMAAISLYKKLGFTKIGRRHKYYFDTNEDALVYEFRHKD